MDTVLMRSQEMFIQHLAEAALNQAKTERKPRRNIQYKDVGMSVQLLYFDTPQLRR